MRSGGLVVMLASSGCWSSDPLIDGVFTPDQWAALQLQYRLPAPIDPCAVARLSREDCATATQLASQLFFDPTLSSTGNVSCATCHDPAHAWIDGRALDNVSFGATGWTMRNAQTILNLGYKYQLASPDQPDVFTWIGQFATPGAVLETAVTKALSSSHAEVAAVIRGKPAYANAVTEFGMGLGSDDAIFANLEIAFDAYLSGFPTMATPFDHYLAGESSTISDSAKRGFAVFVGRAGCSDCHSGPLFSDLRFHDTSVPQMGANVVVPDRGRATITNDNADVAKFLTQPLREIAKTAPYMHDGVFWSLREVIAFYRGGGGDTLGVRDPHIQPLDITDDDALDLEAFLDSLSQCDDTTCAGTPPPPPKDAGVTDAPLRFLDASPIDASFIDSSGLPPPDACMYPQCP